MVVSNIFYFHPYLWKIPILTNIFQRGWFNHQLEMVGPNHQESIHSKLLGFRGTRSGGPIKPTSTRCRVDQQRLEKHPGVRFLRERPPPPPIFWGCGKNRPQSKIAARFGSVLAGWRVFFPKIGALSGPLLMLGI